MTAYMQAIKKYAPNVKPTDATAFNGYTAGEAFAAALKAMKTPTRAGLMAAIDGMKGVANDGLVPGATLNGGTDGRLIHDFEMSEFDGAKWKPVGGVVNVLTLKE
jgi:ABC-type branched-subunit amino acid transport system substrate-binding protein